nr:ABC transporter substrate-binding protein [Chitinivorax tropicus]
MKNKTILSLALGASFVLGASAQAANVLTVCTEASPEGFDITQYTAAVTADATSETIHNRLVEFERGSTKVVPGLAEKWDISKDGLVYTFQLRKGVKFHTTEYFKPSREFNADDVLWTFNRMLDKNHPWFKVSTRGYPYAESMEFPSLIKSVEKVDPHTVKFTLNQPEAPFLADLAMGFASIFSAEYGDQLLKAGKTQQLNQLPIGTGPFVFKRYEKDAQLRFDANKDYWKGKASVDKLIFAISPDTAVRIQKLKAGECQIALYPLPNDVANLRKDPKLKVEELNALMTGYLAFNMEHKPFEKKEVRQAISMAFDKKSYIKALFGEAASPAVNPFPPTMWSYNKDIKDYEYNPQKAKELLAKAGFPNGFKTTIWTRPGGGTINPNPKLGSEMLQADLKKIGVEAEIKVVEWGELLKRAKAGEHDMVFNGWAGDNGDPDNFLTPLLSCVAAKSGENYARWCDKKFDELLDKAKSNSDSKERTKLYLEAQKVFKDAAPWLTLAHPTMFVAMSKNVNGYKLSPLGNNHYWGVQIK